MKLLEPTHYYVLSLIIVALLFTKFNVEVTTLYILSAGLTMYIFKCHCKSIMVGLLFVGLYLISMNVREGMVESAIDMRKAKEANAKKSKTKSRLK
jgi:hypothetical protein